MHKAKLRGLPAPWPDYNVKNEGYLGDETHPRRQHRSAGSLLAVFSSPVGSKFFASERPGNRCSRATIGRAGNGHVYARFKPGDRRRRHEVRHCPE